MSVYEASIDDNDSQVLYSDGWVLVTQDGDWTGTMHSTSVIGSTARVRFTGSRVAVVCTIPTGDGQLSQAAFALDNGSAVKMSHATTPPVQWQTVFWDSGPLAFGSHLLVITNTGNDAYFRLDHIDYDATSANSPSSSVGSGTTTVKSTLTSTVVVGISPSSSGGSAALVTSKLSQSGSESSTASQTASLSTETVIHGSGTSSSTSTTTGTSFGASIGDAASAAAGTSSSNKSSTPTAGIVAGILGGLLGILLLVLALLYIRRRRRRTGAVHLNAAESSHMSRRPDNTMPTPFSLNRAPSEMSNSNLRSNPSIIGSPYGANSFDTASSPMNSTSMYTSGSESSAVMGGHYGQHQFQHLGAAGTASRSKRAEFMAEQQGQLVGTPIVPPSGDYSGGNAIGTFQDQDAPPAYPGRV